MAEPRTVFGSLDDLVRPRDPLRLHMDAALAATRHAYRDSTRLLRLLTVIDGAASAAEVVDRTLQAVGEVFAADIACVVRRVGSRLVVTHARGIPAAGTWPAGPAALEASAGGLGVARGPVDRADLPPALDELTIRSGAWVPLPGGDDRLLIVLRRRGAFSPTDLQVLGATVNRLCVTLARRERGEAIGRLVESGRRLARHTEMGPLLEEAVRTFRELAAGDGAWAFMIEDGTARADSRCGTVPEAVAGWTGRPTDLPGWAAARRGEASTVTAPGGTVLCVPVMRDGAPAALLYAARDTDAEPDHVEEMAVFAGYVAAAMTNAELNHALRRSELWLRYRATHDPLTNLANRTLLADRLDAALAGPDGAQVGLIFCDLDRFKAINDRLGHDAGDELLLQVGNRLRRSLRPHDLLGRFGGDEFVVLLDAVSRLEDVSDVARRLQVAFTEPFTLRGERVQITASVGGVLGACGQVSASAMLRDADAAMYAAKNKGAGLIEVFDEAASTRARDALGLRSDLLSALDRRQLAIHYQPIFALRRGEVMGFEALLRWDRPRRGPVPPDVFVPLAEESGAIVPIGQWLLEQACQQLAAWQQVTPRLTMSVNISAVQLQQPDLAEGTIAVVRASGVDPTDLWLEVTESGYISPDGPEWASPLRAAGFHFTLDDFGMSYSNLGYLKRFPVEGVKIDRSFITGLTAEDTDRSIVRAILAIGDSLGLDVVAEGIETAAQRDALLHLGCRRGQGYLLSRPLPAEHATELLLGRTDLAAA